ncbi:MAG: hypothetical protein KDC32_00570, partial [Saprospiraceae bacterium]|nr:hypothetical protein [Saprospiraceae bacterium]
MIKPFCGSEHKKFRNQFLFSEIGSFLNQPRPPSVIRRGRPMPKNFPFYKQHDAMDCGAACLRMVARHHGRYYSLEFLRNLTHQRKEGVSLLEISDAAEHIGLRTLAAKISFERLLNDVPLPCIAHWRQDHYVVVYAVSAKFVWVADPAIGNMKLTKEEFLEGWESVHEDGENRGVVMV